MIAIRLSVPIACWRKGHAREFWESHELPPPSTCYGALLSLVGEEDRERHCGCRITAGFLNDPMVATVLRTLWQIKKKNLPQGTGANAGPDFQQLVVGVDLVVWCDSSEEERSDGNRLEARVQRAITNPESIKRWGGWSLGESTHLINDATLLPDATPPAPCRTFLLDAAGNLTLPIWVDHVGSERTRYAVGRIEDISFAPPRERVPKIGPIGPMGPL